MFNRRFFKHGVEFVLGSPGALHPSDTNPMEIFWHSSKGGRMFGHPWFYANIPGQSAEEPSGFYPFQVSIFVGDNGPFLYVFERL
jgi:hypothetical protein